MKRPSPEEVLTWSDVSLGLHAVLVIDDTTLGPAVGGIRTLSYESPELALKDAKQLARAMTIKCALAGLDAGGGKLVVMDRTTLCRHEAFAFLGGQIDALGGRFRTAGDLGTTPTDLMVAARHTPHVHTNEAHLADAVAQGMLHCLSACCALRKRPVDATLHVAIQGCGSIGSAVAQRLHAQGVTLTVSDPDPKCLADVVQRTGANAVGIDALLSTDADVLAPCAIGGTITKEVAASAKAWAICGAANNMLSESQAEDLLRSRHISVVPDVLSSAGAVIEGIGHTVMHLSDRSGMIAQLGATTRRVLETAIREDRNASEIAERLALNRLESAREHAERG